MKFTFLWNSSTRGA